MCNVQRVHEEGGTDSTWIRRHLAGSVYLWACGVKANDEEDDPTPSDRLIGWLILFLQGFAYAMLIALAGPKSNSATGGSANDNRESGYLLPSMTGAMYLLVASTAHDLRAGYSLLKDGSSAGHRVFGIGLLIVYGIMITAAMRVLMSTSSDGVSVLLNAVTFLFIADLDEKALQLLSTVPQKWRLFWAMESIGISFALALIAIFHVGDVSPVLEETNGTVKEIPTWFVWAINPAAVTLSSYLLSSALQVICESCSLFCEVVDETSTFGFSRNALVGISTTAKSAKERIVNEPFFCAVFGFWLAQVVRAWLFIGSLHAFLCAFDLAPSANEGTRLIVTNNVQALLYANVLLIIGLAVNVLGVFLPRHDRVFAVAEPRNFSERNGPRDIWTGSSDSRVSSLLVGWGIGYWVNSLLYMLSTSFHGGGWSSAPMVVTILSYIFTPCFALVGIFMGADTDILGPRFGAFVKPAVDIKRNNRKVEYWVMMTVFRDTLILWVAFCAWMNWEFTVGGSFVQDK